MAKKMLVLALLIPALGGCIFTEGNGHRGGHHRGNHKTVVATPVHAHCVGCRHTFRGGIWVGN